MHTRKHLTFKKSRLPSVVESNGATTYSYTIQPLVKIDGKLIPILIPLHKRQGFPKTKAIHRPSNTYIIGSTMLQNEVY